MNKNKQISQLKRFLQIIQRFIYLGIFLTLFTGCKKEIKKAEESSSTIKYFTGGLEDKLTKVSACKDGGFLYCGKTNNGLNGIDGFLMKLDANGNKEWYHTYGGIRYDHFEHAIECSDGGYIAVGQTNSIGKGVQDGNLAKLDYIVKIKASGEIEWEHSYFQDSKGDGIMFHVAESKDHFIYAAGCVYESSFTGLNTILMKIDLAGNLIDSSQYGDFLNYLPYPLTSWNERSSFVSFNENGNVLLGGTMNAQGSSFNDVTFLLSVDQDTLKNVNFYCNYADFIRGLFYVYGNSNFHSAPTVRVLNAPDGYFIGTYLEELNTPTLRIQLLRTDLNGKLLWEKQYRGLGTAIIYDMIRCPDGNILISGTSTELRYNFSFPESFPHLSTMLMKVDEQGNELWTRYGTSDKNANILKGANVNTDGSISGAGLTCLTKEGYDKMFWIKLDADGNIMVK